MLLFAFKDGVEDFPICMSRSTRKKFTLLLGWVGAVKSHSGKRRESQTEVGSGKVSTPKTYITT